MGDVVRKLREAQGLTIRQFAEKAEIAVGALSLLENNSEKSEQRTVYRVAKALEVTVADLYAYADLISLSAADAEWLKLLHDLEPPRRNLVLESARRALEAQLQEKNAPSQAVTEHPSATGTGGSNSTQK